jgi:two-component system cell cycle response regulator DivK
MQQATKVLVIDDDHSFADFAKILLESSGYEAVVSLEGAKALDLAKAHKPDVILMDINMEDVGGLEAIRMLKADSATRSIPIILCSVTSGGLDAAECADYGAADFISKPLRSGDLNSRIQKVLSHA